MLFEAPKMVLHALCTLQQYMARLLNKNVTVKKEISIACIGLMQSLRIALYTLAYYSSSVLS